MCVDNVSYGVVSPPHPLPIAWRGDLVRKYKTSACGIVLMVRVEERFHE